MIHINTTCFAKNTKYQPIKLSLSFSLIFLVHNIIIPVSVTSTTNTATQLNEKKKIEASERSCIRSCRCTPLSHYYYSYIQSKLSKTIFYTLLTLKSIISQVFFQFYNQLDTLFNLV